MGERPRESPCAKEILVEKLAASKKPRGQREARKRPARRQREASKKPARGQQEASKRLGRPHENTETREKQVFHEENSPVS